VTIALGLGWGSGLERRSLFDFYPFRSISLFFTYKIQRSRLDNSKKSDRFFSVREEGDRLYNNLNKV
jgi:hypothetical protein